MAATVRVRVAIYRGSSRVMQWNDPPPAQARAENAARGKADDLAVGE